MNFGMLFAADKGGALVFERSAAGADAGAVFGISSGYVRLCISCSRIVGDSRRNRLLISIISRGAAGASSPIGVGFPSGFRISLLDKGSRMVFSKGGCIFAPRLSRRGISRVTFGVGYPVSNGRAFAAIFRGIAGGCGVGVGGDRLAVPFFSGVILSRGVLSHLKSKGACAMDDMFGLLLSISGVGLFSPCGAGCHLNIFGNRGCSSFASSSCLSCACFSRSIDTPGIRRRLDISFVCRSRCPIVVFVAKRCLRTGTETFGVRCACPYLVRARFVIGRRTPNLFPCPVGRVDDDSSFYITGIPDGGDAGPVHICNFSMSNLTLRGGMIVRKIDISFSIGYSSRFTLLVGLIVGGGANREDVGIGPAASSRDVNKRFSL